MINMDQVRTLEMKVKQTVQLIVHLRKENDSLRGRLSDTEVRLQELETLLEGLKTSQNEMESGIRRSLLEFDHLEASGEGLAHSEGLAVGPGLAVVQTPEAGAPEEPELEVEEAFASEPESVEQPLVDPAPALLEAEFEEEGDSWQDADHVASAPDEAVSEPEPESEPEPQQPGLGIF
jgi:hypothetical protein